MSAFPNLVEYIQLINIIYKTTNNEGERTRKKGE